jgi:hypothetical protein
MATYILSTGLTIIDLGIIQSVINLSTAMGLFVWAFRPLRGNA